MLTNLTPSSAIAARALDTFSNIWCRLPGLWFHANALRCCKFSTNSQRTRPSRRSSARFATRSAAGTCSFTQFLNVCACMSTHWSSWPLICMVLAAWPSGLRATSPMWDDNRDGTAGSVRIMFGALLKSY